MIYQVVDVLFEEIRNKQYDIGLFSSGYESRSTYVPNMLNRHFVEQPIVLGFDRLGGESQRLKNDSYFQENWASVEKGVDADDDTKIVELLNALPHTNKEVLRILVDYSSMSRLWYGAILNWANFASTYREIIIDFAYANGDHREEITPMVINHISCMPGCEGAPLAVSPTLAVFGLGFEGAAALCVYDQLEPYKLYCFWAEPAAFDTYPEIVKQQNDELINLSDSSIKLPVESVQQSFAQLAELISHDRDNSDIVLVPMGAKPHVLASILLSMKFPEVACLRVSASATKPKDIRGAKTPICTRVHFRADGVPSQIKLG